jgi:hypothetical protein
MKRFLLVCVLLIFCSSAYAGDLSKQTVYANNIDELGQVQTKEIVLILDDGVVISRRSVASDKMNPATVDVVGKDARTASIITKLKAITIVQPTISGSGLEKTVTYDCQVMSGGNLHVRQVTKIYENGVEISKAYTNRQIYTPDADVSKLDPLSKAVAEAIKAK